MTDTPINLNKVRKARAKAARKQQADRNAIVHGLPKAARDAAKAEAQRVARLHDRTRRDEGEGQDG